jgi:hypothetical protein
MRYLLIVVGVVALLWGSSVTRSDSASRSGPLFVQAGAMFLAVGLASVDIVQAIKSRHP